MTASLSNVSKSVSSSVIEDPRWARIVARDKTADGQLWYSVSSTGVYCRPSCPSRMANPEHVQLHDSRERTSNRVPSLQALSSRGAVHRR